jgi:hypothetical protein
LQPMLQGAHRGAEERTKEVIPNARYALLLCRLGGFL